MVQAALQSFEPVANDAPATAVIDCAHLARMTFGDRSLEREVLQLFDRQAELLMERMRRSEPAAIATLAHTLKGSATGVGATQVARAAADAEMAAGRTTDERRPAIDRLAQAVEEARAQIATLLRGQ